MEPQQDRDSRRKENTLSPEKKTVRASLRSRRRARATSTPPEERRASGELTCRALADHPAVAHASCIATYEPLATEEDVSRLTEYVADGVRFLVPITLDNLDLSWRDVATGEDLGLQGIELADVIVAPALAVGPRGQRLGQGGGSYDRALPRRRPGVPVIAVVFPDEINVAFTDETHDEPVDAVATREGLTIFTQPVAERAPEAST